MLNLSANLMKTQTEISSECPVCKNKRYYKTKQGLQRGLNKPCKSCSNSIQVGGKGNLYKGTQKLCPTCNVRKPLTDFFKYPSGHCYSHCKDCGKQKSKDYSNIVYRYSKYGITKEDFEAKLQKQDNTCAVCKEKFSNLSKIKIDHDHETGTVRGLLCHSCNVALGHFKDNVDILKTAIKYIKIGNKQ